MSYTTQMNAARQGIITPEMEAVAKKEQISAEELRELMAQGKAVIPANKLHTCLEPNGIGSMLKTKINVNLGTSRDWKDLDMELEKVNDAVKMGAESIMDLSSFGDTQKFRRKLTSQCPAIIGTVPIYDAVVYYHKPLKEITSQEWIDIVEMHFVCGELCNLHIIDIVYISRLVQDRRHIRCYQIARRAPSDDQRTVLSRREKPARIIVEHNAERIRTADTEHASGQRLQRGARLLIIIIHQLYRDLRICLGVKCIS